MVLEVLGIVGVELEVQGAVVVFRRREVVDVCSWGAAFAADVADTCLEEGAWACSAVVPLMIGECGWEQDGRKVQAAAAAPGWHLPLQRAYAE